MAKKDKVKPLFQLNKQLVIQKLGDKTVIFDGEKSLLYTLNQTASRLLEKIRQDLSEQDLIDFLIEKFNVKVEVAKTDYKGFKAKEDIKLRN